MKVESVETSVKGSWISVPGLVVNGVTVVTKGRWLKLAGIHNELWLRTALDEPEAVIRALKANRFKPLRADIFSLPIDCRSRSPASTIG